MIPMAQNNVVLRFDNVDFRYGEKKIILDEGNFSIRENSKITIMGQNGAGKSTIFKLITGALKPTGGKIHTGLGIKIGTAPQMIPKEQLQLSVMEYFRTARPDVEHGLERYIRDALSAVNLPLEQADYDRKIAGFSGGQKARLLLAYGLIQEPDILLLDEPTNNLDHAGIEHLTYFLVTYPKTVIVISHDADFLNAFTDGVLNLDSHTHKVEQFEGNYYNVVAEIDAKLERDRLQNARLEKSIKDRFEKVNKLGGKSVAMNRLARKIREDISEDREGMVEMRREDKTLSDFVIQYQHFPSVHLKLDEVSFIRDGEAVRKPVSIELFRGDKLLISGPNGIGKSTLLSLIISGELGKISEGLRVGYYSQDFSELNFEQTALESLQEVSLTTKHQEIFSMAAKFLLPGDLLTNKVGSLSEGQKGLLCYARFMLQQPGLLIMDEPTNHINFRHIPVIAKALSSYEGAMVVISHIPDFVAGIKPNKHIDLKKLAGV